MIQKKKWLQLSCFFLLIIVAASCGGKEEVQEVERVVVEAEPVEVMVEEEVPELMPVAVPPEPYRTLEDTNSSYSAEENKATQGDNYLNGLYERPFTAQEMEYRPDLDINTVDFGIGEYFFYFTIRLYGDNPQLGGFPGAYGIEFDRTLNGRGDMLVIATNLASDWTSEGVSVYVDANRDVGGIKPMVAEEGHEGSGYDSMVQIDSERSAFARIDPQDPTAVQIAVSYSMLEGPSEFLWGAWADDGLKDPAQYDYHDRMGPATAGSPILGDDYPLKAFANVDNTCRLPFGISQEGAYPGMCKIGIPQTPGCTPVWTCPCPGIFTHYTCCWTGC